MPSESKLTYDANGNVLTYGNMEFEWTNGRVLSQITVNPEDSNGTADVYSYTYDESGIRSSKTVNGVTTYFTTKDGVILSQTDGTNTMYFQYDNSGNPTGFLYNGIQYFYLTNQMGDVIDITDNTGTLIATYTYGAWGEVLATTPTTAGNSAQLAIANANPLRYRGYYLDAETGYYYLQSRYYSSNLCRFLNADMLEFASFEKEAAGGTDIFVYCSNCPTNHKDPTGSIKRTISRWTAETLIETFMYVVAPWIASQLSVANRVAKTALNVSRRLLPKNIRNIAKSTKMIRKYATTIRKAYSQYNTFINKLVKGFVPRVLGMGSKLLTGIRKIIWRATGVTIKALTTYSLKRATDQAINTLKSARNLSIKKVGTFFYLIGFAAEFLSVSGFIAIWLDVATDGRLNNTIKLW